MGIQIYPNYIFIKNLQKIKICVRILGKRICTLNKNITAEIEILKF